MSVKPSLLLHQIEQNRWDSEQAWKDEEIEPNLSILSQSIEKRQPFQNGGVGGALKKIPQLDMMVCVSQNESRAAPNWAK